MWGGLWRTGSERRATSSAPPLFILRIFRERLAWGVFAEGLLARSLAERFLLRILREGFLFGRAAVGGFILRVLGTLAARGCSLARRRAPAKEASHRCRLRLRLGCRRGDLLDARLGRCWILAATLRISRASSRLRSCGSRHSTRLLRLVQAEAAANLRRISVRRRVRVRCG